MWRTIHDKNIDIPKYRVSCKRSGTHSFESPQVASSFGGEINDHCGWIVDLNNFDIEVMFLINDQDVRICITLTKESLHRRNIVNFGRTTLKPTIAYGMLWHCKIQPGDVVCDPLCGSGSILIEALASMNSSVVIGGEIDYRLILKTLDNYKSFLEDAEIAREKKWAHFDIFNWDACHIPLKNSSVDVIVSDLPFGKRVGSHTSNMKLYPGVFNELSRIAQVSSGRACLLTKDKRSLIKSMNMFKAYWKRGPTMSINIGGLSACVYVLYRTATTFS
ncbi:hypothetical protein HELRODRAFT_62761 [Helobdella robusta]|uniref:THUMP domain-containing protein n=1 Tax=Helobdella robusta TaxID=6412 RepID=T1FX47_HELRO|nr:hypothetical protein HELRODRAFT_62761 [Helobdella robusta]ESO12385.1 hypothetical protein HELRODRAFT_62761 [Helobdella robusta]